MIKINIYVIIIVVLSFTIFNASNLNEVIIYFILDNLQNTINSTDFVNNQIEESIIMEIADYLNIKVDVAHRALADVETLVAVFKVMLDHLREKEIITLNDINLEY